MPTSRPHGSVGSRTRGPDQRKSSRSEDFGPDAALGLVDDLRELFQQELRTAREEFAGKARVASEGVLLLGVAVVLGALAAGTSTVMIMRMLEKALPPTIAAAVAAAIFAAAAGVLAARGLAEVRRALPLVPEGALDELREEIRELLPL
jgi:Putative Actinobacterial Holin-X, holin superfamily III